MIPLATIEANISKIAGTPITISCESAAIFPAADQGFVTYGADGTTILRVIHIKQSDCYAAEHIDHHRQRHPAGYTTLTHSSQRVDDGPDSTALGVILHEAFHIKLQTADEGVVECASWHARGAFVKLFGFKPWITHIIMAGITWRHDYLPPAYRAVC